MNTLDLIRKIDPCAGRDPDGARLDARLERLLAEAAREDAAAGQAARPWRAALEGNATPRRRARRAALGLGLAACLAAAAVVVSGGERVAPATAATLLSEARTAVLRLDGPGPWTVVTTVDWRNEPFRISRGRWGAALVPYETETWSSDHGQQLSRVTRRSDVRFPNPSDRDAYRGATTPLDRLDGKLIRRDTAGLDPTVAEIRALPADPAALAAKLGPDAVNQVVMLLLSPAPTAKQRAALYDVLLRTPGAKLVPRLTDPEGRTGEGVRFVKPNPPEGTDAPGGYDLTLLFDPRTHALLAIRQVNDQRQALGRVLTSWDVVLRVARTRTAPRPDLEARMNDGRLRYVPVR